MWHWPFGPPWEAFWVYHVHHVKHWHADQQCPLLYCQNGGGPWQTFFTWVNFVFMSCGEPSTDFIEESNTSKRYMNHFAQLLQVFKIVFSTLNLMTISSILLILFAFLLKFDNCTHQHIYARSRRVLPAPEHMIRNSEKHHLGLDYA